MCFSQSLSKGLEADKYGHGASACVGGVDVSRRVLVCHWRHFFTVRVITCSRRPRNVWIWLYVCVWGRLMGRTMFTVWRWSCKMILWHQMFRPAIRLRIIQPRQCFAMKRTMEQWRLLVHIFHIIRVYFKLQSFIHVQTHWFILFQFFPMFLISSFSLWLGSLYFLTYMSLYSCLSHYLLLSFYLTFCYFKQF